MVSQTSGVQQSRGKAQAASEATPSDAVQLSETLLEEAPHTGREAEYEAVVSYVARRWSHDANTALFVCGGCGCGKTSTVKRALRAMSSRILPCDATGRSLVKRSTLEDRGWATTGTAATTQFEGGALVSENGAKTLPAADLHTPRTSHQLGSDSMGLSPAAGSAMASSATSPAATRRGSQAWVEVLSASSSSPASGRPSASSEDSTASALAAAGPTRSSCKRTRAEDGWELNGAGDGGEPLKCDRKQAQHSEAENSESISSARLRTRRQDHQGSSGGAACASVPATIAAYSLMYFHTRYPEVFPAAPGASSSASSAARRAASSRSLFGHYVNCADVSGPLLVEAICESIQATCTRGDSASQALLQRLSIIGSKSSSSAERGSAADKQAHARRTSSATLQSKIALHVVALDEVEYVRGGGAKTLAQLSELAFQHPGQLALIFISNQRAFVHVPQMMLEALLFEPYSEEQLRRIGADATAMELHKCELRAGGGPRTPAKLAAKRTASAKAATKPALRASDVDIKPRLYDYIARKALLEYSGDVRQVIAMCHRVVTVAWEEVAESRASTSSEGSVAAPGRRTAAAAKPRKNAANAASTDLPAKLEAAVSAFHGAAPPSSATADRGAAGTGSISTSTTASATSSTRGSAALTSSAPSPATPSSSGVMTLARSVRLLQSNQVESDIDRHVGTLPEQTLYVLSCIVVLTLRRQEERTHAMTSVGGRMGTSRTPGAGVAAAQRTAPTLSLKMHEVHQLYTRLMAELHFPAMRADGFPLQVECLADFGVLTRPQLRGTDRIFSLNGTWTLQAMQQALVKRGEAIKEDRLAAGAEVVMENKFEEVLRELSNLMKR